MDNHILAKIVEDDGSTQFLTGFYGWPKVSQKTKSWALLNHIKSFVDGPWVCIGDFNAILCSIEKLSLRSANSQLMEDFHHALEQFELIDLGYKGNTYT